MIVVWAGTSDLVSEPIGQTTTTALMRLVLAAYPGPEWTRRPLTEVQLRPFAPEGRSGVGFLGVGE